MTWLKSLLGGGIVKSIENIALEFIETDKESAEAKALMIKTLDPNGAMRRDISKTVSRLYSMYIVLAVVLLLMVSFDVGNTKGMETALDSVVELFVPITAMFSAIVSASFGVNISNNFKKKEIK